jgi:hypothetical protein
MKKICFMLFALPLLLCGRELLKDNDWSKAKPNGSPAGFWRYDNKGTYKFTPKKGNIPGVVSLTPGGKKQDACLTCDNPVKFPAGTELTLTGEYRTIDFVPGKKGNVFANICINYNRPDRAWMGIFLKPTAGKWQKFSRVKKFADEEYLQKSYAQICEKYNVSTKQAREALIVLEKLGVVKRHFRTIETEMGKCPNVMYIELIPDALYKLTYPEPADENGKTSFPSDKEVFTKKETRPSSEVRTNTKNTTETTTKTTTTAQARDVVEKAEEIFAPLKLSKEDIRAIVREAEYDIDRCIKAKAFFDAYRTPVGHATGLLISFVREDYPKQPRIPPAMNPFNSFSQQIYTPEMIDALEKELLSGNDCPTVAAVQG